MSWRSSARAVGPTANITDWRPSSFSRVHDPLGSRKIRRHRTPAAYHGVTGLTPLVAARRLMAIPFIPAFQDGAFWKDKV